MMASLLLVAAAPMLTLHLDFNSIRLERKQVESTLEFAAKTGYDSILWEVEDKVRWETCPECVHLEAFSKEEFRAILARAKELGLRPIPLLQTFGHAEYVLGCERYRPWRELATRKDCYCVSKPEVRDFLKRWIHEYIELFGEDVSDFHLGGDEARCFGECRICSKRDRMGLYAEHLEAVSEELRARGIRSGIWCDMVLSTDDPHETAKIPRDFTIWHWDYGYRGKDDKAFAAWAGKTKTLTALGFDVIFAASSSCYGDGPFLPDFDLHLDNVLAARELVRRENLRGLCVTSWSVRQGLKGLQRPIWECAVTGDRAAAVRKAFGNADEDLLRDLTLWDADLTSYDGRDWHDWMKDGLPAPVGELDIIMERLEGEKPGCLAMHLEKAGRLEKGISAALEKLRKSGACGENVRKVERGAEQTLSFLRKLQQVLRGKTTNPVPKAEAVAYFASEQSEASASNSAEIVWSVLENGGNAHRNLLACQPEPQDLPELLSCADGSRVASARDWEEKRRPELLKFFSESVYGVRPVERPAALEFEQLAPECEMMDGRAVRLLTRIRYSGPFGDGVFKVVSFIPKRATPAPAFVLICNRNFERNVDPERKIRTAFWPAEEIIARGYAAIAFFNGELSCDDAREELEDGVHAVFGSRGRTETGWGSLSAWAWGASRVMDWIETEPRLDAGKVAVVGHSRGGKSALWAGATDERFALTCVNDSGCGGARMYRVDLPISENIELINVVNPHWYCRAFRRFNRKDRNLPFDQHELLALIAPRLLAVASASADAGAGPYGEYLSAKFASPAWGLYGLDGLVPSDFPELDVANQRGHVSYHLREGGHDLNLHDWDRYMDFAGSHGWK